MATAPKQTRRRPSPRKKPRASRPTRKGTSPYQSDKRFGKRGGSIALLLHDLTSEQNEDIRACFGPQRQQDAEQLLREWTHISTEALHITLDAYMHAERIRILFTGRAGQQRHTRLKKATAEADKAITAVKAMVEGWRYELDGTNAVAFARWTNDVIARLEQEREAIRQYQTRAGQWPKASVKQGPPEEPATYRLKVLAAYFRHHGWEVSSQARSLFTNIAEAVTTGGNPMFRTRLKAIVASRYPYTPPN